MPVTRAFFGKKSAVRLLGLAGFLVLGACAARDPGGYGLLAYDCADRAALADQDWETAQTVQLSVRHGEYTPMVVGLQRGQAYVLQIKNGDDYNRRFHAPDFFRAVALKGVRVAGGAEDTTACIAGLGLPAGGVVEARFVPVRDGRFRFEDSGLLTALTGDGFGVIRID